MTKVLHCNTYIHLKTIITNELLLDVGDMNSCLSLFAVTHKCGNFNTMLVLLSKYFNHTTNVFMSQLKITLVFIYLVKNFVYILMICSNIFGEVFCGCCKKL